MKFSDDLFSLDFFLLFFQSFADDGIGFIRYEHDKESLQHAVFEQNDRRITPLDDRKFNGKYCKVKKPSPRIIHGYKRAITTLEIKLQF